MGITVGSGVFVGEGVTEGDVVGVHEVCGVAVGGLEGVGDGASDGWGEGADVVDCGVDVTAGWTVRVAVGDVGDGSCRVEVGCSVAVAVASSPTTPNVTAYVASPLAFPTLSVYSVGVAGQTCRSPLRATSSPLR